MPPALDKTLEKDGRIHISSPVLSRDVDSSRDVDPQVKLLDDSYTRFWLNLSSLSALDSCNMKSPLELPEMPLQSLFHNSASYKIDLQPSLGSFLGCVSLEESVADCPLLPEDSSFKGKTASEEETRKVSKDRQNLTQSFSLPQYFQREREPISSSGIKNSNQSNALRPECHSASHRISVQEEVDAWRMRLASQHRVLATRTERAKLSLHALLGENALQNFNKRLEEMKKKLLPSSIKTEPDQLCPAQNKCDDALGAEEEGDCLYDHLSQQKTSKINDPAVQQGSCALNSSSAGSLLEKTSESFQLIRGVQTLVRCAQVVLHKAQQALDSDATESSSDDEGEEERRGKRPSSSCLGCEWRYQCERAKLASQWTWLKLRLSELDSQIQQLSQLHQHLIANKGSVVLAEAQPLTDLQIQQTLLTETAGLTLTARQTRDLNSELDTEPSSPTRLLQNIERQSAQLSQIVNSLMSPLSDLPSCCPVAKGDSRCWRGSRKRRFNSCVTDMFQHTASTCVGRTNQKKRRVCRRGQFLSQVDVTQVCARTRPLLTYHKPRLFIMDQSPVSQQGADFSTNWCSSPVSCDPMRVCPDPDSKSTNSRANIISGMLKPNKNSESHCIRTGSFKADWLHQSQSTILSPGITTALECASSIFNCTHDLQAAQTHSKATQIQATPTMKRRRQQRADIDMCAAQSGMFSPSTEDSTEDVLTPNRTNLHQKKSQFPVHRRNGESVYNINNIVIPMSLAASTTVEKLQYKDIPTPSWRVVEFSPLLKKEDEKDINKVESLSDEVFIQRHQSYERREKLSWSSWEKGRRCTHSARSSSSTDISSDCEPTSWMCSRPTDTAQDNMKEREPQLPWERREFPLSKTEEETLRCDEDALKAEDALCSKNEQMDSSLSDSSFKNSVSSLRCAHTPPPAGHTRSNKRRGTSSPN
ncbi:hypothetical protein KOW79_004796 [Hemibagrus wyckioides]|uniref:PEHE domain-containing protein n=1 Tax=Hemibagrus wyckioides TaxID=337641 RepID=A0A9D3P1J4_9TELE|nr:KAT8 regulatory NSL complex subunit 1-like protein isoform X2 [Hemibagrus wyckioides]KAG7330827.1 hypothetical protein KOW79_004796 [Hemibagrus wyckioides]